MTKICIVTCYKQPDYVRARTLRAALRADPANQVIVIKNHHSNALRYPEVIGKLIAARLRHNPDIYFLTFRGYEMLPFFNPITVGKKRVFDELINLVEWVVYEHKRLKAGSLGARLLTMCYRMLVSPYNVILADTASHMQYSAQLLHMPLSKYKVIPVGADETEFNPQHGKKTDTFQVLYYGNMLPLHGLQYVLDAAVKLRDKPEISFRLIGGKPAVEAAVAQAQAEGAHIMYDRWVPFERLPKIMAESAMNLGGPFGGTLQGSMVITGKTYPSLAMGIPTLIGETKNTEYFKDRDNCLIVPQADAAALSAKIAWAYEHQDQLRRIGERGRKLYETYYSSRVLANAMKEVVDSLT